MTASTFKDDVFSGFSFSLLLDSGWYKINAKYVEKLEAGKLMGCGWYNKCNDLKNKDYFCD